MVFSFIFYMSSYEDWIANRNQVSASLPFLWLCVQLSNVVSRRSWGLVFKLDEFLYNMWHKDAWGTRHCFQFHCVAISKISSKTRHVKPNEPEKELERSIGFHDMFWLILCILRCHERSEPRDLVSKAIPLTTDLKPDLPEAGVSWLDMPIES